MTFYEKLSASKVRELCIKHNWCTRMANEEYAAMLGRLNKDFKYAEYSLYKNFNQVSVISLSRKILEKSDTDYELEDVAGEIFKNAVERWCE